MLAEADQLEVLAIRFHVIAVALQEDLDLGDAVGPLGGNDQGRLVPRRLRLGLKGGQLVDVLSEGGLLHIPPPDAAQNAHGCPSRASLGF
eukprot:1424346-Pyramimonas_sp.AAC.1